ncbi:50S ribosomal protein L25/general stress protein Ctc [Quadrisphaera oryzae]|uniref:50S ribosomal protein L25/general stress protein Ctc n=1 Tax=Quadrisphaera TaxID=317661 RepID=UPI001644187D|nr:50S ribosomal protein L25/general stress protein Ctc [Quadrisphaera sp. RL12-1S]MBC3761650.1 50S ribosomal protein L25/general stress protein Ctc [Quadrisphaera sp. RL12-1S]
MAKNTGTQLAAAARTEFGKGAARRIRRDHQVPAVVYGHGQDPLHVTLPGHETMLLVKNPNALVDLQLDGGGTQLAVVKAVQVDPVRREIEHVDLVIVRRGERIEVQVPVRTTGEAAPQTVVSVESGTLAVTAEATDLPEVIEVDVEGLEAGTLITAGDVRLPQGVELAVDAEAGVVNVSAAPTAEELDAELAEAEAEAGIEKDAPEDESAEGAESAEASQGDEGSSKE